MVCVVKWFKEMKEDKREECLDMEWSGVGVGCVRDTSKVVLIPIFSS